MSSKLIRLTYASTAAFKPNEMGGIELAVGQILSQSRRNNKKQAIGGVLHYGNSFFFQCLEGEKEAVEKCYDRVMKDERHRDVKRLSYAEIDQRMFPDWSMKYLPVEGAIMRVISYYKTEFNPYLFSEFMISELLKACAPDHTPDLDINQYFNKSGKSRRSMWSRLMGRNTQRF